MCPFSPALLTDNQAQLALLKDEAQLRRRGLQLTAASLTLSSLSQAVTIFALEDVPDGRWQTDRGLVLERRDDDVVIRSGSTSEVLYAPAEDSDEGQQEPEEEIFNDQPLPPVPSQPPPAVGSFAA